MQKKRGNITFFPATKAHEAAQLMSQSLWSPHSQIVMVVKTSKLNSNSRLEDYPYPYLVSRSQTLYLTTLLGKGLGGSGKQHAASSEKDLILLLDVFKDASVYMEKSETPIGYIISQPKRSPACNYQG